MHVLPLVLPIALVACAAEETVPTAAEESNLDTSGCSGVDASHRSGPVQVRSARPPTASCWNVDQSGFTIEYAWSQTNESSPRWNDVGFWISVNGAGTFVEADAHACEAAPAGGLGHDTSGTRYFRCTAKKHVAFGEHAELKAASYGADGRRLAWNVEVAVARDDGTWDSEGGANYRFSF